MSPTISSRMSSSVTSPISAPYSSTTKARCARRWRNARSWCSSEVVSGMNQGGVASRRSSAPVSLAPSRCDRGQHVLGVQHADDRVRVAAPDRVARVGALQHLLDDLLDRRVGVDRDDVAAVGHDLADLELLEVEDRRPACRAPACAPRLPAREAPISSRSSSPEIDLVVAGLGHAEAAGGCRATRR